MGAIFGRPLSNKFRCGRMLSSRTLDVAGRFAAPILCTPAAAPPVYSHSLCPGAVFQAPGYFIPGAVPRSPALFPYFSRYSYLFKGPFAVCIKMKHFYFPACSTRAIHPGEAV